MLEFTQNYGGVILTVVGILLSLMISGLAFMVKKWMGQLEDRIDNNKKRIAEVDEMSKAENNEIRGNYISRFEALERVNRNSEKNILDAISKLTTKVEVFGERMTNVREAVEEQKNFCAKIQDRKIKQ